MTAPIAARVWRFGDDINTDLMLPGPVMTKPEAEQARAVFAANRPGWIDQMKPGDAIVARRNFGMGSNRPAARSLGNIGIGVVLKPQPVPGRLLALMQGGGIFPLMEKEGLIAPRR